MICLTRAGHGQPWLSLATLEQGFPWPACGRLYNCTVDRLYTTDCTHVLWTDCTQMSVQIYSVIYLNRIILWPALVDYSSSGSITPSKSYLWCPWSPATKESQGWPWLSLDQGLPWPALAVSGYPGPGIAMASPGCPWSPAAKDTKDRIWRG